MGLSHKDFYFRRKRCGDGHTDYENDTPGTSSQALKPRAI